jgi:diguanylate cyclase (GGDEF)-like protein
VVFEFVSATIGPGRSLHATYIPDFAADGSVAGLYILVTDISELKVAEQRMARLARHDALTGLPNRYQLDEKLEEAMRRCRRSLMPMAMMFLDIDHFKGINDTLGHAAGDEVLKEFGLRLKAAVRATDTVARLAGDEFIILLEGLHAIEDAQAVARKILASMAAEFIVDGKPLRVTTSIGIACTDSLNLTAERLMAHADQALYQAKSDGRNTFSFRDIR